MAPFVETSRTRRDWRLIGFSVLWAVFCLAADYATGPGVQFGSLYAIPVVVAAWESQLALALGISFVLPAAEFLLDRMWGSFSDPGEEMFTTFVRVIALVVLALLADRFSRARTRAEHRLALPTDHVARCERCGRVQDAEGAWWTVDERLLAQLPTPVTSAVCRECASRTAASAGPRA